jgi:hypothetical protein
VGYNWQGRLVQLTTLLSAIFIGIVTINFRYKLSQASTELGYFSNIQMGIGMRSNAL